MSNNEMKFDPMTGQPIQNSVQIDNQVQNIQQVPTIEQVQPQNNVEVQTVPIEQQINTIDTNINNIQAVPTVEQSKQDFINNTQSVTSEPKKEKKDGINWAFIIIMFAIILGAIIFVFPYLLKNL